jgi:hypothetical protein
MFGQTTAKAQPSVTDSIAPSARPAYYDTFNERWLDPAKWATGIDCGALTMECVREIQNGHLRLALRNFGAANSDSGDQWSWTGLTFTVAGTGVASPHRAARDLEVDELFLRLLDKRNAQGRRVRPSKGRGYAPAELADDPDAAGVAASAFAASSGSIPRQTSDFHASGRTKYVHWLALS